MSFLTCFKISTIEQLLSLGTFIKNFLLRGDRSIIVLHFSLSPRFMLFFPYLSGYLCIEPLSSLICIVEDINYPTFCRPYSPVIKRNAFLYFAHVVNMHLNLNFTI